MYNMLGGSNMRHTQVAGKVARFGIASYPGRFVGLGGGKTAWYRLFAHARNTPRFVGYRICT